MYKNGLNMKNIIAGLLIFLCIVCVARTLDATETSIPSVDNNPQTSKVFVIPVSGDVEPVMALFIKRAVNDALSATPNPIIVLEMDTFGGRVDAALEIVETMSNIAKAQTYAFVKTKAISAGALIALSCNNLVMRPNTTIGDCAPISFAGNEAKMLGEKFQSPLRAKFRTLARKNGYPPTLAESMVTDRMEVYKVIFPDKSVYLDAEAFADLSESEIKSIIKKTTVVAKGELLTMDDTEALELGFSKATAESITDMLAELNISNVELIRLEQNWVESWGRIIAMISPILMVIGMAALYTEFKAPGFGLPGIVGLICLGLVLTNQHIVGLADHLEIILVVLGILLLGFEIFVIPGFGIAGISGFLLIGAGMILSFQDFVLPDPDLPWQSELFVENLSKVIGAFVSSFLLGLVIIRYGLPRMGKIVDGPYLDDTLAASHADSLETMGVEIGQTGVAATSLRPAGKLNIGTKNIDVVTEGNFIDKDSSVKVVAIRGNLVIVAEE